MDDRELVEGLLRGDEGAFDLFSERFIPALYRFAFFRLDRNRELTADIVQSTVCKAIAKLSTFRGESAFMTWLCACCRTEIAMHFRKESRRPRSVELTEESAAVAVSVGREGLLPPGPESGLLRKERGLVVHMALDLLSARYRRALSWKYLEGLPVNEIAKRLAVSPKAAESVLTRAREAFRGTYRRLLESGVADRGGTKS